MVINKENLGALNTAISVTWQKRFMDAPTADIWKKLAMPMNSKVKTERIAWMGAVPGLREFKSERIPGSLSSYGYDITAKKWESTLDVDRDDLEDDRTGNIMLAVNSMATKAAKHYTKLTTAAFAAAFTTTIFDGQYFFDADHEWGSNYLGTGKDLNSTNLAAAELLLAGQKDDKGDLLGYSGTAIVVGPALTAAAEKLVNSKTIAEGGIAVDNPNYKKYEVVALPHLGTTSKQWALADLHEGILPFVLQIRVPLAGLVAKNDLNSDRAFDKDIYTWGTRARHNVGYGDHQLIVGAVAS